MYLVITAKLRKNPSLNNVVQWFLVGKTKTEKFFCKKIQALKLRQKLCNYRLCCLGLYVYYMFDWFPT